MAYIKELFDENFLEYASYVIKDRAIPYIEDGLKPVQRRILHSLFELDDGKFNKVANVVGHCMKYHPHGDASIYSALVTLANKDFFIDKQGNFGNIFTGDPASAARYIECRLLPLAREVLYNPNITTYEPSYDGRNKEPLFFPAKIPMVLLQGAEGIAVGMATKIMPHNFIEVLSAMKAALNGEQELIYPDFPTGGFVDVEGYQDGMGKVLTRAKIEITDQKTVTIIELPFGSTTESLIASIDAAAKKNKIMVNKINDFTTDSVEIELKLKRGFHANETLDALYAFTDCEKSISVNSLVIEENMPALKQVSEIIDFSAKQLKAVLKAELELEKDQLNEKLHKRTLEALFVAERIYKSIESEKSLDSIKAAVLKGFAPFMEEVGREITDDDIDMLLRIPIRRISLYDIEKAKKELKEIKKRIAEINKLLRSLIAYAISWIDGMVEKYKEDYPRKTELISMNQTSVKEAAIRDRNLRYNGTNGYVGYDLKEGPIRCKVSVYDKILYIDRSGGYKVIDVPDKIFIGSRLRYIDLADQETCKNTTFTALYKNEKGAIYLKRFNIEKYIANKDYHILPSKGCELLELTTETEGEFVVRLVPVGRMKKLAEICPLDKYTVKGVAARGYKITDKEIMDIEYKKEVTLTEDNQVKDVTEGLGIFEQPEEEKK